MRRLSVGFVLLLTVFIGLCAVVISQTPPPPPADLTLTNGIVITVDANSLAATKVWDGCSSVMRIKTAAYVQDRQDCFLDFLHEARCHPSKRALDETGIIDRSNLINEKIGIAFQPARGWHANSQRGRILDEIGGKRNYKSRGMVYVKQGLRLDDEHRPGLPGLGPTPRIQVGQPNLSSPTHQDPVRLRKTPC